MSFQTNAQKLQASYRSLYSGNVFLGVMFVYQGLRPEIQQQSEKEFLKNTKARVVWA